MLWRLRILFQITRSQAIARRYFVVNGFDGALTMLGMTMGFYLTGEVAVPVVISACLGAAIALGMSGLTSAYISEAAERRKELHELEEAMVKDMDDTMQAQATRLVPFVIAVVNGAAPFTISLLIISPLLLIDAGIAVPWDPLLTSIVSAYGLIFLLGVFLSRISRTFWLWAGLRTLTIAALTSALIYAVA